ncbi:MAG: 50S ribosomal protein L11 [Patescibacteria group bacterium]|jgi:large subunit ribosomal protein L11
MPKKVSQVIKMQIQAGQASPAPPVGPILGQHGLNIQDFCTKFNEATGDRMGEVVPVELTVYDDQSFDFKLKTPPVSELIKKYANIKKGSSKAPADKVGSLTEDQVKEIAEIKLPDLNTNKVEQAMETVKGTAKQMGVEIK